VLNKNISVISRTLKRVYHSNVVDHYENPRNVGSLEKNNPQVGTGLVGAPACGDVMKLQIEVNNDGVIIAAKFKHSGVVVLLRQVLLQLSGLKESH